MLFAREGKKDIMSQQEYHVNIHNLNTGQRQIVMYNCSLCKAAIHSL